MARFLGHGSCPASGCIVSTFMIGKLEASLLASHLISSHSNLLDSNMMSSSSHPLRPVHGPSAAIRKQDISYPRPLETPTLPPPPMPPVRSVRIRDIEEKPRIINIEPQNGASYHSSSRRQRQSPTSPQSAFSDMSTPVDYHRCSQSSQSAQPILPPSPTSRAHASSSQKNKKAKGKSHNSKKDRAGVKHLFVAATRQDISIFLFATVASAAVAAAKTVYALFLGEIFQIVANFGSGTLTPKETLHQVATGCLKLTGLGIGMSVAASFLMSLWIVNGETRARTVRLRLFRALLNKEMIWFDTRRGGMASLMTEQYTQIRDLQAATSQLLGYIISDMMVCVACLVVAFVKSWTLTLILLATVPVSVLILDLLGRSLKPAAERQRGALNDAAKHATASLVGIDLVKVYGGYDTELWLYLGDIRGAARHYMRQALSACAQMGYIKVWMINLFVVGFWFGITLVKKGQTTAGNVLTAFYAVLIAFQSLESLGTQWVAVLKGTVAGMSLEGMISAATGSPDPSSDINRYNSIQPRCPPKDIVLDNVTFSYPSNPDKKVLDRCSMRFPAGQVSFVVGRSGSGKSTIADLLVQFYRPTSGRILIDGISASVIDRRWLRENVALIQQASTVFNGTFGWNVALGVSGKGSASTDGSTAPDAVSRDDVKMACETALLQSTVANLAQGLDTLVGSLGASLSGGQRQRLALARAKIRNPAVLLLDETTSGLDPKSAQMVLDAVRTWRRGRTTIIITHDISQIAHADYAYVMEQGRLVQEGHFGWMAKQEGGAMHTLVQSASIGADTTAESLQSPVVKIGHVGDGDNKEVDAHPAEYSQEAPAASGIFKRTSMFSAPFTYHQIQQQGRSDNVLVSPFPNYRQSSSNQHSRRVEPAHGLQRQPAVLERDVDMDEDGEDSEAGLVGQHRGNSLDLICERGERAQTMRRNDTLSSLTGRKERSATIPERHRLQPMSSSSDKSKTSTQNPKAKSSDKPISLLSVLWTVWPSIDRAARLDLVLGSLACLVSAASNPAFSFVFARMLQAFWAPPGVDKQAAGRPWALVLVGLSVVDGVSIFASFYLAERIGLAWVNAMRTQALTRLMRQPKSWWTTSQGGGGDQSDSAGGGASAISPSTIVECLDRGGEEMRKIVSVFVPILLMAGGMVVVSVIWALAVAWKITLVVLAAGPLIVVVATQVASRISDTWEGRSNRAAEAVSAVFSEVFPNIRVVRALTLEDYFAATQLAGTTAAAYRVGIGRAWRTGILYGINQGIPNWLVALVFYYGTTMLTDTASVNALIQVVNLLLFSIGTGAALLGNVPQIAASKTVAAQMLVYASLPLYSSHEHHPDSESKLRVPSIFPVRMDGLVFRYPTSTSAANDTNKSCRALSSQPAVLRNLSLEIQPGELVGIVGPSGGGKSTVLSLLLRLYADEDLPSKLSFAGVSCSDLDTAGIRARMAYVPQQPYLFPATVRHNMAYGLCEDSPLRHLSQLQKAARAAGIDEFIDSLPEGYGTVIGGGGSASNDSKIKGNGQDIASTTTAVSSLSGGQAQRVCVARALLRQPQLLVLDEPTSALDASSADTIRQTIRQLVPVDKKNYKNKTHSGMSIVVATHSKAMMRLCDRLLVVQDGAVAANGSYDTLLRQGRDGVFARLIGETDD